MKTIQIIARIIFVVLMIILYCSCSDKYYCNRASELQKKYCLVHSDTTTHDSIRYRYFYRDTTIYRERDSFGIQKVSPCDSNGRVKNFETETKGKNGSLKLKGDSATNTITGTAICDALEIKLQLQEKITDHYRTQIIRNAYTPPFSKWDRLIQSFHSFLYFFTPLLLLAVILLIYRKK